MRPVIPRPHRSHRRSFSSIVRAYVVLCLIARGVNFSDEAFSAHSYEELLIDHSEFLEVLEQLEVMTR